MALQSLVQVGPGGSGLIDKLPDAVRELQSKTRKVVAGAAANTNIAIPGFTAKSTITEVTMFASGVPSVPTPAAGNTDGYANGLNLRLTENSTGNTLIVEYATHP